MNRFSFLRRRFSIAVVLSTLLLVIGVAGASYLLYTYFQLNQTIDVNLRPASKLLPSLSNLRSDLLSLHAEAEATLSSDAPDYDMLNTQRANIATDLAYLRIISPATTEFRQTLGVLDDTLATYDAGFAEIQAGNIDAGRKSTLTFEIRRSLQAAEASVGSLYQQQEQTYFSASDATFESVGNLQVLLLAVGVFVVVSGLFLVFSMQRASRREAVLASGRLQIAAEVGAAAASVLSLEQLFETTLNLILERFGYFHAAIFLTDEKGEYAILRAATGDAGRNLLAVNHKVLVGSNSTIGQVAFTNRPFVYAETRRRPENFRTELIAATRSELAVPLRQAGQIIGALDVQSLEQDPFTDADISVMQTLADQIAVAIGNAAQFTREQIRAQQMASLSEASVEATAPGTDVRTLLQSIVVRASDVLFADNAIIWLPIERTNEIELYVTAKPYDPVGRRLKREEGLPGQAFVASKPVRIDDYARFTRAHAATTSIRTAMAVPLLWQGQITGVITFTRQEANRPFTNDDEQIAQLLSSQTAAALANINLLQETQNRVNELFTLNQIGQTLTAQTDLPGLYDALRREITRALITQSFQIALYDSETNTAELPYIYRSGDISSLSSAPLGEGLTSIVIRTRQPLRLASREEAIEKGVSGAATQAARSYLGVPILQGDLLLGMIAVQDNDRNDRFSESHERLMLTIASQVGLAIQNLRLLEQTRRRASELASINRITTTTTTIRDVQSMLEGIAREVVAIFNARNTGIALLDPTHTKLTVVADFNRNPQEESARGVIIPLEGNLSSIQVIETQRSLILADPQHDPLTESIHDLMRLRHTECLMIVPLVVRGEVLGTLGIDTDERGRTFTEAERTLCETLVAQVSTALDNNRLFEQTRRRADQLATAAQVSRAAISTLDPDELIVRTTELIRERFNLYYSAIFVVDENSQWAVLRYATGEAGRALLERKHRLEIGGQSMVSGAITTRKARIALDVGQEAVRFNNPLLPDTHSEMAIPLVVGDAPLGALDVQSVEYNAFSDDDVIVLQTMADQIAVSIQNARLYLATERRVRQEQLINRITAKLRRSLDADSIMNTAMSELQDVLGARRVIAQLGPEQLLRHEPVPIPAPLGTRPLGPLPLGTRPLSPRSIPPLVDDSTFSAHGGGNGHSDGNGNGNGNGHGSRDGNGHDPDSDMDTLQ